MSHRHTYLDLEDDTWTVTSVHTLFLELSQNNHQVLSHLFYQRPSPFFYLRFMELTVIWEH